MTARLPLIPITGTSLALILFLFVFSTASTLAQDEVNWEAYYNGPGNYGNSDIGKDICIAPDGNILATGQASANTPGFSDAAVICISPEGFILWDYLYDGANFDMGYCINTDEAGNIYVGASSEPGGEYAFTIFSLTADGNFRWDYVYNPTGLGEGYAASIVVAPDGNLYSCGNSIVNPNHGSDATVVSLTTDGDERWVYTANGASNSSDIAYSIDVDTASNVYVCGQLNESNFWGDFFVGSLTPDGSPRWVYLYNGSSNGWDVAQELVVGEDNNIYAAGRASENGSERSLTAISLTSDGDYRWTYQYNGPYNSHDLANCICYGLDGNIYVGGKTIEIGGDSFAVFSLTTAGIERWHFVPTWDGYNGVWGVTTDRWGNVYAGGWIREGGDGLDYGVVSLANDGNQRWRYVHVGTGDINTGTVDRIVYDGQRTVYSVGFENDAEMAAQILVTSFETGGPVNLGLSGTVTIVPPGGGDVVFDASITSTLMQPVTLRAITMITLPNGNTLGPFFSRRIQIVPGTTVYTDLQQTIPGNAPEGSYTLTGYIGPNPDLIATEDSFEFTKTGVDPTAATKGTE